MDYLDYMLYVGIFCPEVAFDDPTDQHFMRRPRELLALRMQ